MPTLVNKTFAEIAVGDTACAARDLQAGDLRAWANDFACRYHVSGKFYWSDPDYLQVGQGSLDETRVRMALVALGGGPAFLSDRLPELPLRPP